MKRLNHRGVEIYPGGISGGGLGPLIPFGHWITEHFRRPLEHTVREPGLDIAEIDDKVVVKAELPGMEKKDIKVRLEGDILTISGAKSAKREIKKKDYFFSETRVGAIQRSFRLPRGISPRGRKVQFQDGRLTIEFKKSEVK